MIDLHSNNFLGNGKRPFHVFRITVSMFKSRSAKGKPSWHNKAVGESFLIWHDQFVQEIMFHWPMCQFPKGSRHAFKSCLSKKSAKSVSSVERICRLNDIVHICVNAAGILSHAANNCLAKTSEAVSSVTLSDHLWGARASPLAAMQLQIEEESWIWALHLISCSFWLLVKVSS